MGKIDVEWVGSGKVASFPEVLYQPQLLDKKHVGSVPVSEVLPGCDGETIDFNPFVMVDTIHNGRVIPEGIMNEIVNNDAFRHEMQEGYVEERDWGACLIAESIARHLRLESFYEVQTARCVLDFGRFPGISRPWSAHLDRLSVSGSVAPFVRKHCPAEVLGYYTGIADQMEVAIEERFRRSAEYRSRVEQEPITETQRLRESRFVRIAVHTFDEYGRDKLRRPKVGLIHRSRSIADSGHLPDGVFSRHFPDELARFSADRLLKNCLSCAFEKNYIPEISDWPYMLPEGCVELRVLAWLWLRYLRAVFEEQVPNRVRALKNAIDEEHYEDYWKAVLNLNSVHPSSRLITPFLEGQMRDDQELPVNLRAARQVDQAVTTFLEEADADPAGVPWLVRKYQYDAYRPNCIVIEVRKNEIFPKGWEEEIAQQGQQPHEALEINTDFVEKVGRSVKEGLVMYWKWQEQKKKDESAGLHQLALAS